jgi:hypothetical protein
MTKTKNELGASENIPSSSDKNYSDHSNICSLKKQLPLETFKISKFRTGELGFKGEINPKIFTESSLSH